MTTASYFRSYFRNPNTGRWSLTGEGPRLFLRKHGLKLLAVAAGLVVVVAAGSRLRRHA